MSIDHSVKNSNFDLSSEESSLEESGWVLNPYFIKLKEEYFNFVDEEGAKLLKGKWLLRAKELNKAYILKPTSASAPSNESNKTEETLKESLENQVDKGALEPALLPLDLEIGTGNGYFFTHHCFQNPDRFLVGFEIKYKPLYQTLKRSATMGSKNGIGVRAYANKIDDYFAPEEIDNIYIQFPDPWPKRKHHKNRLIQDEFLKKTYGIQKTGGFLEFKTDDLSYFEWTIKKIKSSPYKIERLTYDLHQSEWASENFETHFERLWTRKGFKTNLIRARK